MLDVRNRQPFSFLLLPFLLFGRSLPFLSALAWSERQCGDARAYLREALEREIKAFNEKLREQEFYDVMNKMASDELVSGTRQAPRSEGMDKNEESKPDLTKSSSFVECLSPSEFMEITEITESTEITEITEGTEGYSHFGVRDNPLFEEQERNESYRSIGA